MKLFLKPLNTKKSRRIFLKERKLSFIVNKKKINKIKLKEYFYRNYLLKIEKINTINIKKKKKKKIIVKFKKKLRKKKLIN